VKIRETLSFVFVARQHSGFWNCIQRHDVWNRWVLPTLFALIM